MLNLSNDEAKEFYERASMSKFQNQKFQEFFAVSDIINV